MASLKEQVQHIQRFVETAGTMSGGAHVQEAQCESLVAQLRSARDLSREAANDLAVLLGNGPWTAAQKATLVKALSEASVRSPEDGRKRRTSQQVRSFGRFFSQKDREVLASDVSQVSKLDQLAERCYKIGCVLPTESSYRTILSAAAAAGLQIDSSRSLQLTTDFKDILKKKCSRRLQPNPHMEVFPTDPRELPADIYQAAYGEDDPVQGIDDTVAGAARSEIDLRKTRRKNTQLVPAPSVASSSSGAMPALSAEQWQQQMAMMAGVANMSMNQRREQATTEIQVLKPKAPAAAAPAAAAALPAPPPPEAPKELQPIAAADPEPTGAEEPAEQVARVQKALQVKNKGAKPVEREAPRPKAPSMKRPAASSKAAVLKRPATTTVGSVRCPDGWVVETRLRGSGDQTDKYYFAPDGSRFRILKDARAYGFKGSG